MPGKQKRGDEPALTRRQASVAAGILRAAFDPSAADTRIAPQDVARLLAQINEAFARHEPPLPQTYSARKLEDWRANAVYRARCKQKQTKPPCWTRAARQQATAGLEVLPPPSRAAIDTRHWVETPTIKQEATELLAAMMSPPALAPTAPDPAAPAGVQVKRELPDGALELADLALPPPNKRPRAAEAGAAAPSLPPVHFPTDADVAAVGLPGQDSEKEVEAAAEATVAQRRAAGQPSSRYVGVSWRNSQRRWVVKIQHEGQDQSLGTFAEEEAAARAYDEAARRLRGDEAHGGRAGNGAGWRLNFPTQAEAAAAPVQEEPDEEVVAAVEAAVAQRRAAGQAASRYAGVSWAKRERRWQPSICHEGRQQRLGYFAEEDAAARAYDEAARRLRGDKAHGGSGTGFSWRLNFPTEAEAATATAPAAEGPDGNVGSAQNDQTQVRNALRRVVTEVERQIKREARASAQVGNAVRRLVADVERAGGREARKSAGSTATAAVVGPALQRTSVKKRRTLDEVAPKPEEEAMGAAQASEQRATVRVGHNQLLPAGLVRMLHDPVRPCWPAISLLPGGQGEARGSVQENCARRKVRRTGGERQHRAGPRGAARQEVVRQPTAVRYGPSLWLLLVHRSDPVHICLCTTQRGKGVLA
eukprot:COSAG04_NODE_471_length_13830_cov_4.905251_7_plen_647_part_00